MSYKHIFGPVISRRLGISLGVDLVLHKICSMDCIYCECGKTTDLTIEKKEIVKFEAVKKELNQYFDENGDPDYITFSGSGEPTLNSCIGQVISYIKEIKPDIKVAVLTNTTLFGDKDVQTALLQADLVIPSLDAVSKEAFDKINRPHSAVDIDQMIEGFKQFSTDFSGQIWLEIMILPGVNDGQSDLLKLKNVVKEINPNLVQLNTLDRPGTEPDIRAATREELEKVASLIAFVPTKIIAKTDKSLTSKTKDAKSAVLATIHRRPCTKEDILQTLGLGKKELDQYLQELKEKKKIKSTRQKRGTFYQTIKK